MRWPYKCTSILLAFSVCSSFQPVLLGHKSITKAFLLFIPDFIKLLISAVRIKLTEWILLCVKFLKGDQIFYVIFNHYWNFHKPLFAFTFLQDRKQILNKLTNLFSFNWIPKNQQWISICGALKSRILIKHETSFLNE